ncbi:polysaccharide deacetylase family protein [Aestuariispira ectoiniformans]|uniref:polysaccharide deacetylase family protein n=1 Tax=Aestuariispira ectoiniformans TaxID=2775080 RepID=UPI00223B7EED|nr:polysaccharide deacetylase family protein [Aestuariispira ectoiniformans]
MTIRDPDITYRDIVAYVLNAGAHYWGEIPASEMAVFFERRAADVLISPRHLGCSWRRIVLPEELQTHGVAGELLMDNAAVYPEGDQYDWILAAFSFLSGAGEYQYEKRFGSVQSYSTKLTFQPDELFDYAWANRIFLIIRDLYFPSRARRKTVPKVNIGHDVDALDKTLAIRLKQSAFEVFNTVRMVVRGEAVGVKASLKNLFRMACYTPDYYQLEKLVEYSERYQYRPTFYVYAHPEKRFRSFRQWLFDPGYRLTDKRIAGFLRTAADRGVRIGLHGSFDSWANPALLQREKIALEKACGTEVSTIRQHWLRFSWQHTWQCQAGAGLSSDATLGFNNRPGFRASTALAYRPWNFAKGCAHDVTICPLVLMDSHLYAYEPLSREGRIQAMKRILSEVSAVQGEVSVLWHPHTLSEDYDWREGFEDLLTLIFDTRRDKDGQSI